MKKILITGASGQLGWELQRSAPPETNVRAVTRPNVDLADSHSVHRVFEDFKPDVIINAAAYTAVDKAEDDKDAAFKVNAYGVKHLAELCQLHQARLIHISTDFVFDGEANMPYQETHQTRPVGVYGESKRAGEVAVIESGCDAAIIRTAWVYSAHGGNFVKTMLRLMSEKPELGVVADQIGSPTWASGLAVACWQLAMQEASGVYHYSDSGQCSWYEFACEIQSKAMAMGLLNRAIPIKPLTTEDYPTPAKRPAYSVLDKSKIQAAGVQVNDWKQQLASMLKELKDGVNE